MTSQLIKTQYLEDNGVIDVSMVSDDRVTLIVDDILGGALVTLSKPELDLLIKNLKIARNQLILGGN